MVYLSVVITYWILTAVRAKFTFGFVCFNILYMLTAMISFILLDEDHDPILPNTNSAAEHILEYYKVGKYGSDGVSMDGCCFGCMTFVPVSRDHGHCGSKCYPGLQKHSLFYGKPIFTSNVYLYYVHLVMACVLGCLWLRQSIFAM